MHHHQRFSAKASGPDGRPGGGAKVVMWKRDVDKYDVADEARRREGMNFEGKQVYVATGLHGTDSGRYMDSRGETLKPERKFYYEVRLYM
jgi:hypothetical protein